MNFRGHARRRPEVALELTSLIDVVFLLLIFFLLTTTFSRPTPTNATEQQDEAVIDVQLPASGSGATPSTQERLTLFLDPQGLIYLDSEAPMAPNELKAHLLDLKAQGKDLVVDLKADKRASHGATVELLDLVKQSGIETVNFVIEKAQ